ncbi:hypothetical protein C7D73_30930, partial [Klebsiella pneumoniae]
MDAAWKASNIGEITAAGADMLLPVRRSDASGYDIRLGSGCGVESQQYRRNHRGGCGYVVAGSAI